ncbi:MAG: NHL repeat-containing protein [Candidatus Eremiobacteraeota bacterium]|nr:NHL repeat-containing protein [Candidatus Eremiobacteraeota bacterium]
MKKLVLLMCAVAVLLLVCASQPGWAEQYRLVKHFGYLDGWGNAMRFPTGIFVQEGKGTKYDCDDRCKYLKKGYEAKCRDSAKKDDTRIFVADWDSHRLEKYDMDGHLLKRYGDICPMKPYDLVIDNKGAIHSSCEYYDRIRKVNSKGYVAHVFFPNYTNYAEIGTDLVASCDDPRGMALCPRGNIVIADYGYRKIFVFDDQKRYITSFSTTVDGDYDALPETEKKDMDPLPRPIDVAVDGQGNCYVCYNKVFGVRKFNAQGQLSSDFPRTLSLPGSEMKLGGLALDRNGSIFVTDMTKCMVHKISPQGSVVASWGRNGQLPGDFYHPMGIAVDSKDRVYVVDHGNHRVQVFAP